MEHGITRVLIVMEPLLGGTLRHLELLVSGLPREGFHLALAVSFERDRRVRERIPRWSGAGVEVLEVPMRREPSPLHDFRGLRRLADVLARGRFDVLHTHSSKAGFLGRLAARLAGFKGLVVHTPHVFSFEHPFAAPKKALFTAQERAALKWTDRLVLLTRYQELLALHVLGAGPEKRTLIPNGVDTAYFHPVDRAAARRALGVGAEAFVIGFAGRYSHQKGLDVLVDAVDRLSRERGDLLVLHAGDLPPPATPLGKRIELLSAQGRFRAMNVLDDVRPVYAASDVIAMPSRWEGMPYVALEAMAMARPVVATIVSGMDEVIENEANGLLVPPDNAEALGEAIGRVRRDPAMAGRLGRAGVERAARQTMKGQIRALASLYDTRAVPTKQNGP